MTEDLKYFSLSRKKGGKYCMLNLSFLCYALKNHFKMFIVLPKVAFCRNFKGDNWQKRCINILNVKVNKFKLGSKDKKRLN